MTEETLMQLDHRSSYPEQEQPENKRFRMVRRTYIISIIFLLVTIIDSLFQFSEYNQWQILADAAGIIAGLVLLILSFSFFLRGLPETATHLVPFVILAAYAPGDLFLEGVTLYNLLSGILVLLLAYFIFRPRNTAHWLRMAVVHIFLVIIFSIIDLFPRFDITTSPSWQLSLPIFTLTISILILWQIIANWQIRSLQTRLMLVLGSLGLIPTVIASFSSVISGWILQNSRTSNLQFLELNVIVSSTIAIITLGVTITIAINTARNISNPIQTLSQETSKVWRREIEEIEPLDREDEIGELSITLSMMTRELLDTTENLENIVAERTRILERRAKYLETTSQISSAITGIYELDNLLNTVVHLISDNFGFYHVGIFLLDDTQDYAVLRAASSEGGWRMLSREHKLQVGKQGIVGYVTGTGEPRVQQQVVGDESVHYNNPDLPLTKSEMALPLMVGNEILGALDVQSVEEQAFSEEDVSALQVLADSVAVAIQNTRLVQQLQESLQTERRIYGDITREAWKSILSQQETLPAFRSDLSGTQLVTSPTSSTGKKALDTGKTSLGDPDEENPFYSIAVPVRARGGTLVGVIETKKPIDYGEWSKEEILILETVSSELGLALENARLFEDTQRKAQKDRIAAELASKIWASSDFENILKTTVRELGSALQVSRGTIRLTVPDDHDT